ncbi:unnamed protein product [Miscanthus lutarioriparius]|uniref:NAC domain-containing protein n=1 Tax=Miscanthus lutarioriparius TaxID=422564 RepID=A0A811QRV5_9POAL|nr:unnamed protein product [Miscanthus lutarioriparius]
MEKWSYTKFGGGSGGGCGGHTYQLSCWIMVTGDICDGVANGNNRWHKTRSSKPVFDENGVRNGWKKILVLYKAPKKVGGKPERENWAMHQYHLGVKEDETNGEFLVCKVFYQSPSKKNGKS